MLRNGISGSYGISVNILRHLFAAFHNSCQCIRSVIAVQCTGLPFLHILPKPGFLSPWRVAILAHVLTQKGYTRRSYHTPTETLFRDRDGTCWGSDGAAVTPPLLTGIQSSAAPGNVCHENCKSPAMCPRKSTRRGCLQRREKSTRRFVHEYW